MKKLMKTLVILLIINSLLGCSKPSNENVSELEQQFSTAVPLTDINRSLEVVLEGSESFFRSGSDINLLIHNRSNHSIYFENDVFVRLLVSPDHLQWVDVKNEITYFGTRSVSPQGTPLLDFEHTVVRPIFDPTTLAVGNNDFLLRIVITGEIMEGDTRTGQEVGSYLDVVLKP